MFPYKVKEDYINVRYGYLLHSDPLHGALVVVSIVAKDTLIYDELGTKILHKTKHPYDKHTRAKSLADRIDRHRSR